MDDGTREAFERVMTALYDEAARADTATGAKLRGHAARVSEAWAALQASELIRE